MTLLTTFVITTWLLAMLPGVGQALMLRQAIVHGRAVAWATIAGTSSGLVLWSLTAAAGLSAVLLANELAYSFLRWAGGLFLAYVGVRSLLASEKLTCESPLSEGPAATADATLRHAFATGLATNLGNPKAGVFALSLLPQFAPTSGRVVLATIGLGVIWATVTGLWYILFVWLVQRWRHLIVRTGTQRAVLRGTGVILLALGSGVVLGI